MWSVKWLITMAAMTTQCVQLCVNPDIRALPRGNRPGHGTNASCVSKEGSTLTSTVYITNIFDIDISWDGLVMKIMKTEEQLILTPRKLKIIKCWALLKKRKRPPKSTQTLRSYHQFLFPTAQACHLCHLPNIKLQTSSSIPSALLSEQ